MASLPARSADQGRLKIRRRVVPPALPSTPRPARRDCHGRLASALLALIDEEAEIAAAAFRPWCSATFVGAQHRLTLALAGPEAHSRAEALALSLPEAEFRLPGHIVADLVIDAIHLDATGEARLEVSALTIEDW